MRLVRIINAAAVFLALGTIVPAYAQEGRPKEQPDKPAEKRQSKAPAAQAAASAGEIRAAPIPALTPRRVMR